MIAREKGLEPLAKKIFPQDSLVQEEDLEQASSEFLDEEKGVGSVEEALAGARDIMAEWMNEDAEARKAAPCPVREEGNRPVPAGPGQGEGRPEIQRLLRLGGAGCQGAVPPDPCHAPGREREGPQPGLPAARRGWRGPSGASLHQGGQREQRAGPPRRPGRLPPSPLHLPGNGTPTRHQEAGGRGSDPGLHREPAATPPGPTPRPKERAGHRPRVPNGLQGRLSGWAG